MSISTDRSHKELPQNWVKIKSWNEVKHVYLDNASEEALLFGTEKKNTVETKTTTICDDNIILSKFQKLNSSFLDPKWNNAQRILDSYFISHHGMASGVICTSRSSCRKIYCSDNTRTKIPVPPAHTSAILNTWQRSRHINLLKVQNIGICQGCTRGRTNLRDCLHSYNTETGRSSSLHDDVIKWKHFPSYWPFVPVIHRSPVNSPHKGQWRGELVFSLICAWINGWVSKQSRGWWFETPSRSLWRHWNVAALVFTGDVEACLSQSWLIINAVQWHSLDSSFARDISTIEINLKITYSNFHSDLQGINVLNTLHKA